MIFILLSAIGLFGKSFLFKLLLRIYDNSRLHKCIAVLFLLLIVQSVCELLSYYAYRTNASYIYGILICYYFCLFYTVSLLPFIALSASNTQFPRWLFYSCLSMIAAITFLLVFSRLIIADVAFIDSTQSITRVAGPYYFVFQVVSLITIVGTQIILLMKSYDPNYFVRVRSRNLCLAFVPLLLICVFALIAMAVGVSINVAGTLTFSSLIYLAAMVDNIRPDRQPDYMVFVPFSKKNRILVSSLNRLVYMEPGINKQTLDEQLIDYYLSQPGLKQKEIAKILNISEPTLSRRKQQLKQNSEQGNGSDTSSVVAAD